MHSVELQLKVGEVNISLPLVQGISSEGSLGRNSLVQAYLNQNCLMSPVQLGPQLPCLLGGPHNGRAKKAALHRLAQSKEISRGLSLNWEPGEVCKP